MSVVVSLTLEDTPISTKAFLLLSNIQLFVNVLIIKQFHNL